MPKKKLKNKIKLLCLCLGSKPVLYGKQKRKIIKNILQNEGTNFSQASDSAI